MRHFVESNVLKSVPQSRGPRGGAACASREKKEGTIAALVAARDVVAMARRSDRRSIVAEVGYMFFTKWLNHVHYGPVWVNYGDFEM